MSGTYIAIYVKYMFKQHHSITDLWYECEYFNMCIHINDSYYMYIIIKVSMHTGQYATNKIFYAVFKYMYVYYTYDKLK